MDPIHPIVPQPPRMPPIAPAPAAARVDRDGGRREPGSDGKRHRRPAPGSAPVNDAAPDAVLGPHIDLKA
jgi:hypothetical protein